MKTVLDLTWKWEAQRTISCMWIQRGSTLSARSWKITGDFSLQFVGQGNDSCFSHADQETNVKMTGWGGKKCQLEQGKSQSNLSSSCLSAKGRGMGNEWRHQNKHPVLYCSCIVTGYELCISHSPVSLLHCLLFSWTAHKQKLDTEFIKKRHYATAVHSQRDEIHITEIHRLLEVTQLNTSAKHVGLGAAGAAHSLLLTHGTTTGKSLHRKHAPSYIYQPPIVITWLVLYNFLLNLYLLQPKRAAAQLHCQTALRNLLQLWVNVCGALQKAPMESK